MDQKLLLLEEKVIVLLNKLKDNHLQIQKFESEMITLQEQHKDLKEKHVNVSQENASLKVANSLLGSNESKANTKRKLNSLIKEVDQCLYQIAEL
jgi:regulator of replication initiation timing